MPKRFVFFAAGSVLLAFLQGLCFGLQQPWLLTNVILLAFSLGQLFLAIRFLVAPRFQVFSQLLLVYLIQLALLVVSFLDGPPDAPRLLLVSLILTHLFILLTAFLTWSRVTTLFRAALISSLIVLGALASETVPEISPRIRKILLRSERADNSGPYPVFEGRYLPGSVLKSYYATNKRLYFKTNHFGKSNWWMRVAGGADATLTIDPNDAGHFKVEIKTIGTGLMHEIQLNFSHLQIFKSRSYEIAFRARADQPRRLVYGIARSRNKFDNLGFFQDVELKTLWQSFHAKFKSIDNERNARIHFDGGLSPISFEIASASLYELPAGQPVDPTLSTREYFVSYRFNSAGCRGAEFARETEQSKRVLLLGDSFTLGIGVHEEDTFAGRLQQILNDAGSTARYEVMNCGMNGYGTKQQRQLFSRLQDYRPAVVVLILTNDDEQHFLREENNRPLFYTVSMLRRRAHIHTFSDVVESTLSLQQAVQTAGGRLGIVIFRNNRDLAGTNHPGRTWNRLKGSLMKDVDNANIPVLDLQPALFANHSRSELSVLPDFDDHPNEIAHLIAAQEIYKFLSQQKLIQ